MSESLQETYAPRNACFGCGPANEQGLQIKSRLEGESVARKVIRSQFDRPIEFSPPPFQRLPWPRMNQVEIHRIKTGRTS